MTDKTAKLIQRLHDAEQLLIDILTEEINKEIVAEVAIESLLRKNWYLVTIADPSLPHDGIGPWIQSNIKGEWRAYIGGRYVFEFENDAVLFKLRWL